MRFLRWVRWKVTAKAVCFVADALQELKRGTGFGNMQRRGIAWKEYFFKSFGETDEWESSVHSDCPEGIGGRRKLSLASIDDHKVGPVDVFPVCIPARYDLTHALIVVGLSGNGRTDIVVTVFAFAGASITKNHAGSHRTCTGKV